MLRRLFVILGIGLAACTTSPAVGTLGIDVLQSSVQFAMVNPGRAWATPARAQMVIERALGREFEQIIALENETTLEGDNFLWLRARQPNGTAAGPFRLADFSSRINGIPYPFTQLSDRDLRSASDGLGDYFWLEFRTGTDTNCVLGFRRIASSARLLPNGTNSLEVLLRNCVNGSLDSALGPLQAGQISAGATATVSAATGGSRLLSPLAGPTQ